MSEDQALQVRKLTEKLKQDSARLRDMALKSQEPNVSNLILSFANYVSEMRSELIEIFTSLPAAASGGVT